MKTRIISVLLLAATACMANQQTFSMERKYKVGDKDVYAYKVAMEIEIGSVDLSMDIVHTVTKVYENGDADIEVESANTKILLNGQETQQNSGSSSKVTTRVNKFFVKQKAEGSGAQRSGAAGIGDLMMSFDKVLTLGTEAKFEYVDPDNPKKKSESTVLLQSVDGGVAKVLIRSIVTTEGQKEPQKVNTTAWFDVASGKPKKYEGTISGMRIGGQGGPDMAVKSASFTITRT
ncbi:MAG: hypothetical protein KF784_10025 [Fimbriimonadaceae bacterium]|nr:hypothetical protein [Fimbriimonadaceae bacterium]